MRSHVQITCLLLGVLSSPGSGATIGSRVPHIASEWIGGPRDERAVSPARMTDTAEGFRTGPVWPSGSDDAREEAVSRTPEHSENTTSSLDTVQQATTPAPSSTELGPLLNEEELIAFERKKMKTTEQPSTSLAPTTEDPDSASQQAAIDKKISKLEGTVEQILKTLQALKESNAQQQTQPPTGDITTQKAAAGPADTMDDFRKFLPQLEEALKSALEKEKPVAPQFPATDHHPQPPVSNTPSPPNADGDIKAILPGLEEALGSILKDGEEKLGTTTVQPVSIHRPQPMVPDKPTPNADGDIKAIFPGLEEALGSILKDGEGKLGTTTVQPVSIHRPQPMVPDKPTPNADGDIKDILPGLEEALSSILKDSEEKVTTTTVQPVVIHRPHPLVPNKPTPNADGDIKTIPPGLEEALGSILKDSEEKLTTTTVRPVRPVVQSMNTNSKQHFLAILPHLEEAIKTALLQAELEEATTVRQQPSLNKTPLPSAPTINEDTFNVFFPGLKLVFGNILQNPESDNSVAFLNRPHRPIAVTTPLLHFPPTIKQQLYTHSNAVIPVSPTPHSVSPFHAVKSASMVVRNDQDLDTLNLLQKPEAEPGIVSTQQPNSGGRTRVRAHSRGDRCSRRNIHSCFKHFVKGSQRSDARTSEKLNAAATASYAGQASQTPPAHLLSSVDFYYPAD